MDSVVWNTHGTFWKKPVGSRNTISFKRFNLVKHRVLKSIILYLFKDARIQPVYVNKLKLVRVHCSVIAVSILHYSWLVSPGPCKCMLMLPRQFKCIKAKNLPVRNNLNIAFNRRQSSFPLYRTCIQNSCADPVTFLPDPVLKNLSRILLR